MLPKSILSYNGDLGTLPALLKTLIQTRGVARCCPLSPSVLHTKLQANQKERARCLSFCVHVVGCGWFFLRKKGSDDDFGAAHVMKNSCVQAWVAVCALRQTHLTQIDMCFC